MPAWEQLTRLARAMGADWNYESAAEVMQEIGEVIPFYSGASHDNLARDYGRQWPCTTDRPLGTALLFAGGETDRPFKFVPVARPPKPAGNPDGFPFTLVFGHSLYYWHQNVLIRHSETLKREYRLLLLDYPDGFVEINTDDAKRLGIRDGGRIRLSTAGGSLDFHRAGHLRSPQRHGVCSLLCAAIETRNARRGRRRQIARSGARGKGGGMKARIVDQADVLKIVDLLRARGYEVIAPFCGRGRDSYFDTVTDANRERVQIHLPNPYYPPKRFVFPHIERLMKVRGQNGEMKIEPTYEEPKRAIFGIRSCDVAGLWHLDRFYLGRDFRDVYYEKRRQESLPGQRRLHRPGARHRRGLLLPVRRHRSGRARPF